MLLQQRVSKQRKRWTARAKPLTSLLATKATRLIEKKQFDIGTAKINHTWARRKHSAPSSVLLRQPRQERTLASHQGSPLRHVPRFSQGRRRPPQQPKHVDLGKYDESKAGKYSGLWSLRHRRGDLRGTQLATILFTERHRQNPSERGSDSQGGFSIPMSERPTTHPPRSCRRCPPAEYTRRYRWIRDREEAAALEGCWCVLLSLSLSLSLSLLSPLALALYNF